MAAKLQLVDAEQALKMAEDNANFEMAEFYVQHKAEMASARAVIYDLEEQARRFSSPDERKAFRQAHEGELNPSVLADFRAVSTELRSIPERDLLFARQALENARKAFEEATDPPPE